MHLIRPTARLVVRGISRAAGRSSACVRPAGQTAALLSARRFTSLKIEVVSRPSANQVFRAPTRLLSSDSAPSKIEGKCVVAFHYALTVDGKVIDSTAGRDALEYVHGSGSLIPGMENALEGKAAGDTFNVVLPPEEAYGTRDEEKLVSVPISVFQGVAIEEVKPGAEFQNDRGDKLLVVACDGENATVDFNHPLADKTLHFEISVESIRTATEEELNHGHSHGAGGGHGH